MDKEKKYYVVLMKASGDDDVIMCTKSLKEALERKADESYYIRIDRRIGDYVFVVDAYDYDNGNYDPM